MHRLRRRRSDQFDAKIVHHVARTVRIAPQACGMPTHVPDQFAIMLAQCGKQKIKAIDFRRDGDGCWHGDTISFNKNHYHLCDKNRQAKNPRRLRQALSAVDTDGRQVPRNRRGTYFGSFS